MSDTNRKKILPLIGVFLLNNWSRLLLLGAIIVTFNVWNSYRKEKQSVAELKSLSLWNDSVSNSKIKTWIDKYGQEHKRAENLSIHSAAMESYADSVARLLKIKPSQVTSISTIASRTKVNVKLNVDTVKISPVNTDSISQIDDSIVWTPMYVQPTQPNVEPTIYTFHFHDPWTKIDGSIGDLKDSLHYEATDTLKRTDYKKRKWLFGPYHYYTDLTNSNPHVSIEGYKGVELNPDKGKHWSVGPSIDIAYPINGDFQLNKPFITVGLSIQYTFFKF